MTTCGKSTKTLLSVNFVPRHCLTLLYLKLYNALPKLQQFQIHFVGASCLRYTCVRPIHYFSDLTGCLTMKPHDRQQFQLYPAKIDKFFYVWFRRVKRTWFLTGHRQHGTCHIVYITRYTRRISYICRSLGTQLHEFCCILNHKYM